MDGYPDEKWKLSKKGSINASSSGTSKNSNSGSSKRSSSTRAGESMLRRSESVPANSSFSKKCSSVVKEQRAKFYIVRRCVTMLVCWKNYRDS